MKTIAELKAEGKDLPRYCEETRAALWFITLWNLFTAVAGVIVFCYWWLSPP